MNIISLLLTTLEFFFFEGSLLGRIQGDREPVSFDYRDELTVQDGIILRGERIVIPSSMRREMKQSVHASHTGINSCLCRARKFIYWPGTSAEIRQYVESCDTCSSYSIIQSKEPLFMHEVPSRPWEKIGTDIFTLNGRHYLITVGYYSQFF